MNKRVACLISVGFLIIFGCEKDDIAVTTGIVGTVKYGQGGCMPVIDYENRVYNDYNGKIYFIVKKDWDNLGDGDYDQLKNSSISVRVRQGKLTAELPAETYLVILEDVIVYSEENTITIKSGEYLKKDFKFFMCTSY